MEIGCHGCCSSKLAGELVEWGEVESPYGHEQWWLESRCRAQAGEKKRGENRAIWWLFRYQKKGGKITLK
jgi:hypothetical protein